MHFNQKHSCLSAVAPVPAYNYSRPHRREAVLSSGATGGGVRGSPWGLCMTGIRLHLLLGPKTVGPLWNYDLMSDLPDWAAVWGEELLLKPYALP